MATARKLKRLAGTLADWIPLAASLAGASAMARRQGDSFIAADEWGLLFVAVALLASVWAHVRVPVLLRRATDPAWREQIVLTLRTPGEELRSRLLGPMARMLSPIYLVLPPLAAYELWQYGRYEYPIPRWINFGLKLLLCAWLIAIHATAAPRLATRLCLHTKTRGLWTAAAFALWTPYTLAGCLLLLLQNLYRQNGYSAFGKIMELALFTIWIVGATVLAIAVSLPLRWTIACAAYRVFEWRGARLRGLSDASPPEISAQLKRRRRGLLIARLAPIASIAGILWTANHYDPKRFVPRDPDDYFAAWREGDYARAKQILIEGIRAMPRNDTLYMNLSKIEIDLGEQAAAAEHLRSALEIGSPARWINRAYRHALIVNLLQADGPAKAREEIDKGIAEIGSRRSAEARTTLAALYEMRAEAFNMEARYADALAATDEALALRKRDWGGLIQRGDALLGLGRDEEALAILQSSPERKNDEYGQAQLLRGCALAHLRRGRWSEALAASDGANAHDDGSAANWLYRAIAADKLGLKDKARDSYRRWLARKTRDRLDTAEAERLLPGDLKPYLAAFPGEDIQPPPSDPRLERRRAWRMYSEDDFERYE